jgi:hypothetical protein
MQGLRICKELIVILPSRYPSVVVDTIDTIALLLLFLIIIIQGVYNYTMKQAMFLWYKACPSESETDKFMQRFI